MTRRLPALAAVAALAALALAGCAQDLPAASGAPSSSPSPSLGGGITVDAAASLNEVFPKLAASFQQEHPGTTITFNFGGSSTLAASIVSGATVDVFAAASTKTMRTVQDASLTAGDPVVIARNELEIAVPPGNPGRITGLADFGDAAKTVVVCDRTVPCGAAATQVFDLAKVAPKPDSYEPDVTSVLTKVEGNEADAGLVYVTDVRAAGSKVEGIPFPEADEAVTAYPIAPLKGSRNAALAGAWVAYVQAHEADLRAAGFLAPR
ncbi:molybdate ABC transporter substrate-binding protein [Amnibacterium kyonggiense]|uniref:Molybdate transport system substrate-binding protein n=1 Tax=Amnibacterium kyonggiense TaxID=595671 RepID=A0A4V3EAK9_9MICO|nr:molybdate ABC transporter substrate-binding protein [Amnibacterium kyonggiense]TDS76118.1 molybdate transport system substrate-binding protein [Amnibacterium kyonggiense]